MTRIILGVSKPEVHAMHATRILRCSLSSVLRVEHAARVRCLLRAVEALVRGRRLTLTDLARSWPGATWMHAPLKSLDRLLSNAHAQALVTPLHGAMAAWLIRQPRPVLLVDWADLKRDGRWCLLRAAVPVGGRTLTVLERIFPIACMNTPKAQRAFLVELKQLLPGDITPILVTDAGFRSDWLRAVRAHGWHFIGRLRNNTGVCAHGRREWRPCMSLHEQATSTPRDLGRCHLVKGDPMEARLVLVRRARRGREHYTRTGSLQQGTVSAKARKAAREPWLLVTSLGAHERNAVQVVADYAKRMQIEEAFRDLKSHRYGMGLEDSQTRSAQRLSVLLLLHALATFAAWLMALAARIVSDVDPLARQPRHRNRYSWMRRGMEWLRHGAVPASARRQLHPPALLRLAAACA
jgi:hypothetical protein